MRQLIATVFNYSLDGLLADEGTDFWEFCFSLPENNEPDDPATLGFLYGAYAHHGPHRLRVDLHVDDDDGHRSPVRRHPERRAQGGLLTDLKTAEWANTTIAAGDTAEEIDQLRQGGDGYIVVWGGVRFWRSLMQLDLIDEIHVNVYPYVAGEGTRLFDGVPNSYRLDLVSTTASSNGVIELRYRRHR